MKFLKIKSKKGITPIIAIILLMMMTVAAAGAAFFWVLRLQSSFSGGVENYGDELTTTLNGQVIQNLAQYDSTLETIGNLTVVVQNVGGYPVSLDNGATSPTTTLIIKDDERKLVCSTDGVDASPALAESGFGGTLEPKSRATLIVELDSDCNIANDTTYPNGSKFTYEFSFSGQANVGGDFIKN
jgi:flagellin-like protein